jgi:hypothetical protein
MGVVNPGALTLGDWDALNKRITDVAAPVAGGDAANMGWVQGLLAGLLANGIGSPVVTSVAAIRSTSKAKATSLMVAGYYKSGDGGGGLYQLDSSDTTSADNGGTIIVASDGGRWKLQLTGPVSVKQFGAKGDGVANDSAAISATDSAPDVIAYYFPPGTYRASNLTLVKPFSMSSGAVIKYNGTASATDVVINFNGSNQGLGAIYIDANNQDPLTLLLVNGNNNNIETVNVSNQIATPASLPNGAVKLWGNGNRIKGVYGINLTNTGNANVSVPQLLTFGGTSTDNVVNLLDGYNIRAGVVAYSTGTINFVDHANYREIQDNGCYMTMGYIAMKSMSYDGYDEALVSIGGGGDFGTVSVTAGGGSNAVLGVNANGPITIGQILLHGPNSCAYIIRSRGTGAAAVGSAIKIGLISGGFYGAVPIYLNDTGMLDSLSIGRIDITHSFNAASYTGSYLRLDAAKHLSLGPIRIKVIDTLNNTGANTGDLHMVINSALSYPSVADTIAVSIYNSDGVTPSARQFYADSFFQQNMSYIGSANFHNSLASIQKWDGSLSNGGGLFSSAAPTAGYWRRGQHVWRSSPNASATPGWMCVVAGTPGTWVSMANLQAS